MMEIGSIDLAIAKRDYSGVRVRLTAGNKTVLFHASRGVAATLIAELGRALAVDADVKDDLPVSGSVLRSG